MPVVSRPPILRVGHHRDDVGLQRLDIEPLKLRGIGEALAERVPPSASADGAPGGRVAEATSPNSISADWLSAWEPGLPDFRFRCPSGNDLSRAVF